MEDVDALLLMSLSTVPICAGLSGISDLLDPAVLLQVALDCMSAILPGDEIPKVVPTLTTAKYQLCILLTQKLKMLGFRSDIGFNMFLYPNLKDVRVLMSFIAEKLPKEEEKHAVAETHERPLQRKIRASLRAWVQQEWAPPFDLKPCKPLKAFPIISLPEESSVPQELKAIYREYKRYRQSSYLTLLRTSSESFVPSISQEVTLKLVHESNTEFAVRSGVFSLPPLLQFVSMPTTGDILGQPLHEEAAGDVEDTGGFFAHELEFAHEVEVASAARPAAETKTTDVQSQWAEETASLEQELERLVQEEAAAQAQVASMESRLEEMKQQQESAVVQSSSLAKELEKKHATAVLITSASTNLAKLKQEIQESQRKLDEMKRGWEEYRTPLVEEVKAKRECIEKLKENYTDKIEEIKQMKEELQEMASEAQMKDEMLALLSEEEAKSSTKLNRNLFILRITEVIDKLKRQKHEIAKIMKDVQDMQSSISFNREALRRVDSATEDLVFQEAKKDASAKVMYKMLMDLRTIYDEFIRAVEEQNSVKNTIRDVEIRMDSVKTRSSNHDIQRLREDLNKIREESRAK